jgi:hypothetical protein
LNNPAQQVSATAEQPPNAKSVAGQELDRDHGNPATETRPA